MQGEKPCICKVCNTAYKTSGGLAAHRKAHAATCGAAYATGPGSLADQTAKQAKMTDKESDDTVNSIVAQLADMANSAKDDKGGKAQGKVVLAGF